MKTIIHFTSGRRYVAKGDIFSKITKSIEGGNKWIWFQNSAVNLLTIEQIIKVEDDISQSKTTT